MTPEEIKQSRKLLKLTQSDMADRIGITPRHYQRIESGEVPLTGAMRKIVPLELKRCARKQITSAQFKSIKDQLTLGEIANIIRAMGGQIKIQHPSGLVEPQWAKADYISSTSKEILIQSKVNDKRFTPYADHDLMKRLAVCLYDMTELVQRCKFDEKGEAAFNQAIKDAVDVLSDAAYPVI